MTAAELMEAARGARRLSYCPYSRFSVGAALECADGSVYLGANIENASYPASNCAERACPPCGICRQVLREFCGEDFRVIFADGNGGVVEMTLGELLPHSFGPENL